QRYRQYGSRHPNSPSTRLALDQLPVARAGNRALAFRPKWYSAPDGRRSAGTGYRSPCAQWSSRPLSTLAGPRHKSAAVRPGRSDPRSVQRSPLWRVKPASVARSDWSCRQAHAPGETGSLGKVDALLWADRGLRLRRSEVDSRRSLFRFCTPGAARLPLDARSVAFFWESLRDRPASAPADKLFVGSHLRW